MTAPQQELEEPKKFLRPNIEATPKVLSSFNRDFKSLIQPSFDTTSSNG